MATEAYEGAESEYKNPVVKYLQDRINKASAEAQQKVTLKQIVSNAGAGAGRIFMPASSKHIIKDGVQIENPTKNLSPEEFAENGKSARKDLIKMLYQNKGQKLSLELVQAYFPVIESINTDLVDDDEFNDFLKKNGGDEEKVKNDIVKSYRAKVLAVSDAKGTLYEQQFSPQEVTQTMDVLTIINNAYVKGETAEECFARAQQSYISKLTGVVAASILRDPPPISKTEIEETVKEIINNRYAAHLNQEGIIQAIDAAVNLHTQKNESPNLPLFLPLRACYVAKIQGNEKAYDQALADLAKVAPQPQISKEVSGTQKSGISLGRLFEMAKNWWNEQRKPKDENINEITQLQRDTQKNEKSSSAEPMSQVVIDAVKKKFKEDLVKLAKIKPADSKAALSAYENFLKGAMALTNSGDPEIAKAAHDAIKEFNTMATSKATTAQKPASSSPDIKSPAVSPAPTNSVSEEKGKAEESGWKDGVVNRGTGFGKH